MKRLDTVVLQARLSHILNVLRYGTTREKGIIASDMWQAQIWAGTSTPITQIDKPTAKALAKNMTGAPWTAVVMVQAAGLGYRIRGGPAHEPPFSNDKAIMEVVDMDENERSELQTWRRARGLLWVGQLLRPAGRSVRGRWCQEVWEITKSVGPLQVVMSRIFEAGRTRLLHAGAPTANFFWTLVSRIDGY